MDKPLVNKVAASGLITINLEDFFPKKEIVNFDLKSYLFKELVLKEKDFRLALKELNWEEFEGKVITVYCSTDAIIPVWAFMLVAAHAEPFADELFFGQKEDYLIAYYNNILKDFDGHQYEGKRVVIKGCSDQPVPPSAYMALTHKLRPFAQSIMYGEPCSTVPIFKRPRQIKK